MAILAFLLIQKATYTLLLYLKPNSLLLNIKKETPFHMQCPLLNRQDLKSATKQPDFYIYMDSGYLISFEIFDDY